MSDDEADIHSDEGIPQDTGPSEAALALQKRKQQMISTDGLDEAAEEMLEQNRKNRDVLQDEIQELRTRSERRKKERAEEDRRINVQRVEEDARRKSEEEERKEKKKQEAAQRKAKQMERMAEVEKMKGPSTRNFVITKSEGGGQQEETTEEDEKAAEKKSKEQLEAEKQAILKQRIHPLEISGFDSSKLAEKARELHAYMYRLESEKYDLEKRFKEQQYDMMELAERARSMNKVGKGGLKRVQLTEEASDRIQEKYAGTSAKVLMYSNFERQKDKRSYVDRRTLFTGPVYGFPPERIAPTKIINWTEDGEPVYEGGSAPAPAPPAEEVAVEEE